MPEITAEFVWTHHRAALGGKSAVSGADLPEKLKECPAGVKASHYGIAVACARLYGAPEPPVPDGVAAEEAERVRRSIALKSAG